VIRATAIQIVLVEDNQADVFLVEEALREHGIVFDLVHYENGDEALVHLCPGPDALLDPPDLILLDLHMPGTDGHEILRALRTEARLANVPVVIITGADLNGLRDTDLTGSTLLVHKSMDIDEYMRKVRDAVLVLSPYRQFASAPRREEARPPRGAPETRQ